MLKDVMKIISALGILITGFLAIIFAVNSMLGGNEIGAGIALIPAALVFGAVYIAEHKSA